MSFRQRKPVHGDVRNLGIFAYKLGSGSYPNRAQNFYNLNWALSMLDGPNGKHAGDGMKVPVPIRTMRAASNVYKSFEHFERPRLRAKKGIMEVRE